MVRRIKAIKIKALPGVDSLNRGRSALIFMALFGSLALLGACSDDEDSGADIGEECTTSGECKRELVCRSNQCIEPQAPDERDAGSNGSGDTEEPGEPLEPVDDEDYYISYLHSDERTSTRELHVLFTGDGSDQQLTSDEHPCEKRCWLSYDMKRFIWMTDNADTPGSDDLHVADVQDLQIQDGDTVLAEGIQNVRVLKNGLTYTKDNAEGFRAYFVDFDGQETEIGSLGDPAGIPSGWFVSPEDNLSAIFTPTLASMDVLIGEADGAGMESVYTFDAMSYYEGTGSFYSGNTPTVLSRDAKVMAMVTEAPNYYGECSTSADCEGPVKYCTAEQRCAAIELTVNFFDIERLDNLGGECADDEACGPIHQCDLDDTSSNDGLCIPGRTVLGLPDTPFQKRDDSTDPESGCALSEGMDDYRYTNLASTISFDEQGRFYGVAQRNCSSEDKVGGSEIIQIDPTTQEVKFVWGNPEMGYDGNNCWDEINARPDDANCVPYITGALLSPGANDFAVNATNPNIDSDDLAVKFQDIWRVRRNGADHKWIGGHSIFSIASSIAVHPAP